VYVTLNPCLPALLSRANERLVAGVGRTKDTEIQHIRNLLIDLDPIRPEGISSTDAEHEAALDMAQEIQMDLSTAGWPEPLVSDSGNGAGLIYAVDLPATAETTALIKSVLEVLATKYAETLASLRLSIDTSVHNPARLTRFLGTMNCKGDPTRDRPHRLSRIISLPTARAAVSRELLKTIAQAAGKQDTPQDEGNGRADGFDLAEYLAHYGVDVVQEKPHHGGVLYCLQECIFDSSHSGNEAAIGQAADGLLYYQCFHKSCKGRTWEEARKIISRTDNLWQFTNLRDRKSTHGSAQGGECRDPGIDTAPWPIMAPEAFYGLGGSFVHLVEPHTESDPAALLLQFLTGFGNLIGKGAYAKVEADMHYCNLYSVAVGETSKSRKGTSWGQVKSPLTAVDPIWRGRVKSGLSSGEGLIFQVRDPLIKKVARKVQGQTVYEDEIVDSGEDDKRLLVVETEFANVLRQIERQGNILSAVARDAWDTGDLATLTKNSPTKATGAHVSIIGHITKGELKRYLTRTEAGNGFGNRILWFCVMRSKVLPEGGRLCDVDFAPFLKRLGEARVFAQCAGEVTRDAEARSLWAKVYPDLSEGKPGMVGALTSRAEAQVLRLSMIYALVDGETFVRPPHLLAALAVWDYCESSVRYIFGQTLGDPVADGILEALQAAPNGLTRTEIYNLFGRHQRSENIQQAIGELLRRGLISIETIETGGRPGEKIKYA
ncbi:MAG: hypothetical protein KJ822_01395, partial [Proteobacteria bacterium]|nr:hypothetical protein [Pseudomonadota bacterium]